MVKKYKAAILAIPVKPTIKMVNAKDLSISQTLPRNLLWEAQTPQGFDRDILLKAHGLKKMSATKRGGSAKYFGGKVEVTDDSMLVENLGVKVKIVMGHARNIKITTGEDLELAQRLL
jgi:2-C-methyl-D-erythritol 4-phosphate cytidylyltransferase